MSDVEPWGDDELQAWEEESRRALFQFEDEWLSHDDVRERLTDARRAPVTPIPVSEPPGDEDWVVLCRVHMDAWGKPEMDLWSFDISAEQWYAVRDFGFRFSYGSKVKATHYLLLRKGE